jgi:hypothetical protein
MPRVIQRFPLLCGTIDCNENHFVVKANEIIFTRPKRKNSDCTFDPKDVNQESSHHVCCE